MTFGVVNHYYIIIITPPEIEMTQNETLQAYTVKTASTLSPHYARQTYTRLHQVKSPHNCLVWYMIEKLMLKKTAQTKQMRH